MSAHVPFMNKNDFAISVNGLSRGKTSFLGYADKEFFARFENNEILDAGLNVALSVDKRPECIDIECDMDGTITVPCDRCLAPVAVRVSACASFRLRMKGGNSTLDDDREEVFLSEGSDIIDLSQDVYDFSLLALPLQRFHSEGECDKAALDYLSEGDIPAAGEDGPADSPFSALADMLNSKKN